MDKNSNQKSQSNQGHSSQSRGGFARRRFSSPGGSAQGGFGGKPKFGRPSFGGRSRPSFGGAGSFGSRGAGGPGGYSGHGGYARSRGGSRHMGERIDFAKFVNKAVITEEVEHFKPEHQFVDFAVEPALSAAVKARGYVLPTPIQDRAIPHVLKNIDVVGIANTGTGKTAAFLIPSINKVLKNPKEQILIVVPTRELAIQIETELQQIVKDLKIYSVCCVGGAPIGRQISQLRYQYNFIIGTPGRLKDLVDRKLIKLEEFKTFVLDEADRMLDMGFVNDMRFIAERMPKDHQTLFFSATLSQEIEKLIKDFLRDPVRISVKTGDTAKNVDQDIVKVEAGKNKLDILHELLNQKEFSKVLIFGRTKHGVEKLSRMLAERGFKAESIHGDKNHTKRQQALTSFKVNKAQVLVATDVAARGIDIADVTHVINYDIPATYDDYVHRIGRTGRGNKKGKALTFIETGSRGGAGGMGGGTGRAGGAGYGRKRF